MKKKDRSALFEFAYCPKYDEAIRYLATTLADPECWEFSDATVIRYTILRNYLEHIYRKVDNEGNIFYTPNNSHACFNTGLITKNLEEIYAFFEAKRYKTSNDKPSAPYVLKAFLRKSDNQLLRIFCGNLPDIAYFFNKPEDLIFNPRCELIPQIDHIIQDNADRFPIHMQGLERDEIRRRLEGAIKEVKQRVKTNYKLAVPQYYNNKIQLLLPLCLTPGSPNADLALVAHKISENSRVVYTARTCLTLKMAYNNARLIVKPQSSWLIP